MTKSPLLCWLLPTGSWPPCFLQLMTGCGSPVALQFNVKVSPGDTTTFAGGFTVNRGRETTTNSVLFSTLPKRFTAEQKYASESSLRTCKTCNALPLYLTLSWGNWPDVFLQVTTGVGCPVTWQIGKEKVLPSMAWWGPEWRETRGRTATKKILFQVNFCTYCLVYLSLRSSIKITLSEAWTYKAAWVDSGKYKLRFLSKQATQQWRVLGSGVQIKGTTLQSADHYTIKTDSSPGMIKHWT